MISNTPSPPYYAVIFSSLKKNPAHGYNAMAEKMEKLAALQSGFLGIESARNELGITISYWQDLKSIQNWKSQLDHAQAQSLGRTEWYSQYKVRIARVERDYEFVSENDHRKQNV